MDAVTGAVVAMNLPSLAVVSTVAAPLGGPISIKRTLAASLIDIRCVMRDAYRRPNSNGLALMRTTLQLDDDVLSAARALAEQQGRTLGEVVSELARKGLAPEAAPQYRNGIRLMPVRANARPTALEEINRLRDELPWAS